MGLTLIEKIIIASIIVVLSAFVVSVVAESQSETIELKRDDWYCAESQEKRRYQPMMVGKVQTMMPVTRTECVNWKEKSQQP